MSKIYEALLRAELERTVSTGDPSPESVARPALHGLLSPEAPDLAAAEVDPLGPTYTESPTSDETLGQLLAPVDFSEVLRTPWEPQLSYMPALQERGQHVEQFRSLRSHILEARDANPIKSLVVSSGLPGEGKSFIVLNLALSFSRHKANRVLLIDGDMRRSSLHKILGTRREPGLTDFIAGSKTITEIMQRCDTKGRHGQLHPGLAALTFIPGGHETDNAGDLAAHPRFTELITTAGSWFDWIFIDSPPANLVSDAVSLSRACSGVLLVAREATTRFKTAQLAQAQFKSSPVLGFILNAVSKLPVKEDYYGGYDAYKPEA